MKRFWIIAFSSFLVLQQICYAEKTFSDVERYLQESVAKGKVAGGVVLVYHKNKIVFQKVFGYADIASKKPYKLDTPVIIASISKPVLGTALFKISEAGKLKLGMPITEYLPEFKKAKLENGQSVNVAPTVVDLLTHRSGLRGDYEPQGRIWYQSWTSGKSMEFVSKEVAARFPFKVLPGKRFEYSGIGTDIAARVAEVASGFKRNEMLLKYFSLPLDMNNTYYRSDAKFKKVQDRMPTRYYIHKETGALTVNKGRPIPDVDTYTSSGGTVISTAPDLLKWLLMIKNGGLHNGKPYLSSKAHRKMLEPHKVSNIALGGLFVRSKNKKGNTYGHTGSSGTNVWVDFKNDVIGIMLTQTKGKDIKEFRKELEKRITNLFE